MTETVYAIDRKIATFREPMVRIELTTYSLPWSCSTAELHRQNVPEPRARFELATYCLQNSCSTAELPRPRVGREGFEPP